MNYNSKKDFTQSFYLILSPSIKRILEIFLKLSRKYRVIYPSQTLIAQEVGLERETVNRLIKILAEHGFITKKKRYNTTSIYTLSPWFVMCADELRHIFPVLKNLPLAALLSFGISNVTSSKIRRALVAPEEHFLSLPQPYYGYISLNLEPDEVCFVSQGDILQKNSLPYDIRELIFDDNTKKGQKHEQFYQDSGYGSSYRRA